MNCRECQRDMSPCLDGRLPSGRRSAMMAHLEACQECAKLWGEFQQAQELVLRMPVRPVSSDFHTRLWERIKAGEGTPPAVFAEAMPLATKARYVFTGAAAAALMLVFINSWMPGAVGSTGTGKIEYERPVGGPPSVTLSDNSFPFVPFMLADQAARAVVQDYRALRTLQRVPEDQLDESTLREIRENTRRAKSMGRFLLWLQSDQHVELPRDMEVTLRLFGSSRDMDKLESMRNRRELRATLSAVIREMRSLEQLPQEMKVRMAYGPEEQFDFQRKAAAWLMEEREPLRYLHIQISGQPGTPQLSTSSVGPGGSWRFFFAPPQKPR